MEHKEVDRQTAAQPDGTWEGSVTCTCGWTGDVSGRNSPELAALALQVAWIRHSEEPDPAAP